MSADPWAGMADPRKALANFRSAPADSRKLSQEPPTACESASETKTEACGNFRYSRNFRRPPTALSQSRGENSNKKTDFSSSSYIGKTGTYAPSAGLPDPDPGSLDDCAPAKVAKPRKYDLTHSDRSGSALAGACESFAVTNTVPSPTAHLSGPPAWREGLARLSRDMPPCPGFRGHEWADLHRVIAHFMDHCAVEAAARGWDALSLFGVHRDAGAAAVESCGALMLPLHKNASEITADAIAFGRLVYRRRPLPEAVLAWDFAGGIWREPTP